MRTIALSVLMFHNAKTKNKFCKTFMQLGLGWSQTPLLRAFVNMLTFLKDRTYRHGWRCKSFDSTTIMGLQKKPIRVARKKLQRLKRRLLAEFFTMENDVVLSTTKFRHKLAAVVFFINIVVPNVCRSAYRTFRCFVGVCFFWYAVKMVAHVSVITFSVVKLPPAERLCFPLVAKFFSKKRLASVLRREKGPWTVHGLSFFFLPLTRPWAYLSLQQCFGAMVGCGCRVSDVLVC